MLALSLSVLLAQAQLSLMFGGDVIPHDPIKAVAAAHARTGEGENNGGWDHVLGPLRPAFEAADVAVVNLETPIVTVKRPERGNMVFHAGPGLLGALKRAGVDVTTFANNHCLDQHREGIVSTRAFVADAGLLCAGADVDEAHAWTPLVFERRGLRIGILAVGRFLNGFNNLLDPQAPHVPMLQYAHSPIIGSHDVDMLLSSIKVWAPDVDALFVVIHWGVEYRSQPEPEDVELARAMLNAGAFAVIGHHPHVLQPVTFLERDDGSRGLVAFSLGNLLSNQDFADPESNKRDGLLLRLELGRATPGGPVALVGWQGLAVATENRLAGGRRRNVQAQLVDEELETVSARLDELKARTDKASRDERKRLEARKAIALRRKTRIAGFLPPAPPP